ncbi:MAG: GEVED domain-containing protein [Bacteroidales bacterium]
MRKILFVLVLALATSFSFAQGNFKSEHGERPPINLNEVPTDAYEAGKIRVKFYPAVEKSIPDVVYTAKSNGFVVTGIKAVDNLNQEFGAVTFTPLLNGYYDKSENNSQYRERHKAWGFHLWFTVEVNSKADVKEMVKKYSSLSEVEYAEPIYKKKLIGHVDPTLKPNLSSIKNNDPEGKGDKSSKWAPNDAGYSSQWHYHNTGQNSGTVNKDIDLPEAWDIEKGSSSVIVAIIDGGIQTNHPDISANMWSSKGYNFVTKSSILTPEDHGTHVAGTVAAVTNNSTGVAGIAGGSGSGNGVRLMSCQVFSGTGSGGFDQASIYAADNGAAISQNSWGYTSVNVYEQAVLNAIDYFNANGGGNVMTGGITIYAAGNDNATGNWYPGCYSGSFSVAATNNKDVRSYYSNYGSWINISAPGGEQTYNNDPKGVYSTKTNNGYMYMQGTSMACPHVSGVAALLVSNAYKNGLKLTRTQVASLLTNNTDNHYSLNSSYTGKLGSGRLNAHKSLVALQSMYGGGQTPSVPTNLSTTNITATSATLNWSAVTGAASYDIQFRKQGGTWSTSNITGTSANATTLSEGTTYEWQIRANNSYGSSSYSSIKAFTTSQSGGVSYCESKGNNYSYEWISKVVVGSFSNTSQAAGYTDFTSKSVSLEAGRSYNISLTPSYGSSAYSEYWRIWIDINGDGIFSANELVFDAGGLSKTTVNGTITIPAGTSPITTRMRVSMKYNAAPTACEVFGYGEVEDYTVIISGSTSDTQPPTTPTGLTASNITSSSAQLSWNASTDNVGVTGYDVYMGGTLQGTVATNSANVTGLSAGTSYSFYVKAKDAAGNVSGASNTYSLTTTGGTLTYCTSKGATSYEWIDLVELNQISNTTAANGGYGNFTNLTATVARGSSQTIYFSAGFKGSSYTEYWHVWIDWNQNGVFDADERMVYGSSSSSAKLYATFTVPSNALLGTTRMRVTMKYNTAATACETFGYGEVEDYTINVVQSSTYQNNVNPIAETLGFESKDLYSVYPNPANDHITVSLNGIEGEISVRIYDLQGRLVKQDVLTNSSTRLDVSNLSKGVYIISVDEEKMPINKQFIKL